VDDLFAPPGAAWQRVSPRLGVVRRSLLVAAGVAAAAAVTVVGVVGLVPSGPLALLGAVLLGALVWGWWVIGRGVRRWGYAELGEELYITRGALFRRLVVVPYGRMQYVDVNAGPLDQVNGIAKLELHTASPGTSAVIPGLPAEEAARLRDRLTALGESRAAGL
jgi:membrane protein YdbS with pleckstrin-like domain